MTALATSMPLGWARGVIDDGDGVPVFYAYAEHREGSAPFLHFESTSEADLIDQVHEALDAWQTDLEMRAAMAPSSTRKRATA